MTTRSVAAAGALRGSVQVPGDKSASHRALLLSALASGRSTITGLSRADDVRATGVIAGQLGAEVTYSESVVTVEGPTLGLRAANEPLDCGNSGTTMRLVAGLVSGIAGTHVLIGDSSLSRRPMDRVAIPLTLMGATVSGQGVSVTAPLKVIGSRELHAIDYHLPVSSAQVKSSILLAGLAATTKVIVREDVRTRSTTEDMLLRAGVSVESTNLADGRIVELEPSRPQATTWIIPGDPSQAAFFAVLGAIHTDAEIEILNIDSSPERNGFIQVLQRMAAQLSISSTDTGISLRSVSSKLTATEILSSEIPSVDEVPALTVAAAAANGVSVFRDMGELRVKESDRFASSMELAAALGCRTWSESDDFFIEGVGGAKHFNSFDFDGRSDHRMVMSSAIAGAAGYGCRITGAQTVSSSYPLFFDDLAALQ